MPPKPACSAASAAARISSQLAPNGSSRRSTSIRLGYTGRLITPFGCLISTDDDDEIAGRVEHCEESPGSQSQKNAPTNADLGTRARGAASNGQSLASHQALCPHAQSVD